MTAWHLSVRVGGFQNPGVCLQAFPSFPSPSPLFWLLHLSPCYSLLPNCTETLATQANWMILEELLCHFITKILGWTLIFLFCCLLFWNFFSNFALQRYLNLREGWFYSKHLPGLLTTGCNERMPRWGILLDMWNVIANLHQKSVGHERSNTVA